MNTDLPQNQNAELTSRIAELERQLEFFRGTTTTSVPTRGGTEVGVDQLRAVFDSFSGGMAFSRDGIMIDANLGLAKMLGKSVDQLLGQPIVDFIDPADRELVRDHVVRGVTEPYEHRVLRPDGKCVYVEAASMVPADGSPLRFTVLRDISDQHQQQEEIDRERRLFQTILRHLPAGVFVAEVPSGRPVLVNEFNRILLRKPQIPDVTKEELATEYSAYRAGTDELYPFEQMPIVRAMSGEECTVDDIELRFDDGTSTRLQINGAPIYDAAGKITLSVVITQDITIRKRVEEKLQDEQEFLRGLIKTHERDRQLLAYEVHDGLVQYITAAVWHVDSVVDNGTLDETSRGTLKKTQDLLRKAIADARRVLSGLRPPVLDERGIVAAIEYLVEEHRNSAGPAIEFVQVVKFRRLEPLLEGAIFRIVQESLTNARKHSGAKHVLVRLSSDNDRVKLAIEDDGCGFRVKKKPASGERFGLQGILKRAELFGGTAKIESSPGKGTKVLVDLPLNSDDELTEQGTTA